MLLGAQGGDEAKGSGAEARKEKPIREVKGGERVGKRTVGGVTGEERGETGPFAHTTRTKDRGGDKKGPADTLNANQNRAPNTKRGGVEGGGGGGIS